jgi:hypothetical protein
MSNDLNVVASGQLTPGDMYRFYLTALARRFRWFLVIMAVVGSWFVVSLSTGSAHWEWTWPNVIGPMFPFVLVPYAFFVAPYFTARKQVRTNPNLNGPLSYGFSDTGIEFSGPNTRAHLDWKAIIEVRETSAQFLFYPQQAVAHVIPKRFLASSDDQAALRTLSRARVQKVKLRH